MNKTVSVLQVITSLGFLTTGFMKAYVPYEELRNQMLWVEGFSPIQVQMIAVLEILGALGLLLPFAIKKLSHQVAVVSGLGLSLVMAGAMITHVVRMEIRAIIPPLILGAMVTYVSYIRRKELHAHDD